MVKVKFITGGANSAFGGFSAGDVLVCSESMARHLVDEIRCAKYDQPRLEVQEKEDQPNPAKRGRKPKTKDIEDARLPGEV